jgi:TonB family protein
MRARVLVLALAAMSVGACSDGEVFRTEALAPESAPEPIVRIRPRYPEAAIAQRLRGHVTVDFVIGEQGVVDDVQVIEFSNGVFEEAAVEAIRRWRYGPYAGDGTPVMGRRFRETIEFGMGPP